MSFDLVTSYERPLLRPLVLPAGDPTQESTVLHLGTQSQLWRASTHVFHGTDDRDESAAWPPTRFGDDPASIPSNEAYNISYDAANLQPRNAGEFKLYNDQIEGQKISQVPPPRLVAKRYVPTDKASSSGQGITLLTLAGMGAPKEARETDPTVTQAGGN
ncbi:hypothetical protein NM208_g9530 [Fusarium decemcellulare]|uniref:Uncharacterized protein n=1 Tax=Fusarium decemcellulare TaxID=57161 RepID=A0ACC1S1R9_9HYPO|nr:hypothetical protein NM208_g9530 [Fusarium decemcellulare]